MQVCKSGRLASTVTLPELLSLQVRACLRRHPCLKCLPPAERWRSQEVPEWDTASADRCAVPPPYSLQHMPIEVAAAEVGVCVTTFKKVRPASPLPSTQQNGWICEV